MNDRLLTEREIDNIVHLHYGDALKYAIKAQNLKTAAAVNAEWVKWGESMFADKYLYCLNSNYPICKNCSSEHQVECAYFKWQERKKEISQ